MEQSFIGNSGGILGKWWFIVLEILVLLGLAVFIVFKLGWFGGGGSIEVEKDSPEVARLKSIPMETKPVKVGERYILSASGSEFMGVEGGINKFYLAGILKSRLEDGGVVVDILGKEIEVMKKEGAVCYEEEVSNSAGRKLDGVDCSRLNEFVGNQVFLNLEVTLNGNYVFSDLSFYSLSQ